MEVIKESTAQLKLGDKLIAANEDYVYIIAEIGQNHQGDLAIAKKLILEAKSAGCDCVKFQKSALPIKFTKKALERSYNGEHSWGQTYGEHKRYLEFSLSQYQELQTFCQEQAIDFTASAMDEMSVELIELLQPPFIKIGSGDANNFPLLQKCAQLKRSLVISTGMQHLQTVDKIVEIMSQAQKTNFALMHCVSAYPTAPEDCTLQMIQLLRQRYPQVVVGYSGHEEGVIISAAAVLLGARILERHITLDKSQKGSDHKCSLEPGELQHLVRLVRQLQSPGKLQRTRHNPAEILDTLTETTEESIQLQLALRPVNDKVVLPCEFACRQKLGKSLVAARALKRGSRLCCEDICIKVSEPNGLPAEDYERIQGAELCCDIEVDMPITCVKQVAEEC